MKKYVFASAIIIMIYSAQVIAQNIYTARGYWQESTKPSYLAIKEKKEKGLALSHDEEVYAQDYESYLLTYQKMKSYCIKE